MVKDRTGTPPGRWRAFEEKFLVEERLMSAPDRGKLYRAAVALIATGTLLFVVVLANVFNRRDFPPATNPCAPGS